MNTDLKTFLTQYVTLSDVELEDIVNKFKRKVVKKNDYLTIN